MNLKEMKSFLKSLILVLNLPLFVVLGVLQLICIPLNELKRKILQALLWVMDWTEAMTTCFTAECP